MSSGVLRSSVSRNLVVIHYQVSLTDGSVDVRTVVLLQARPRAASH